MKNKIIDESISLFSEKGYYNTSLNEIAQKVNIKKASLYYHFKNKDDIYIECLNYIEFYLSNKIQNHLSQQIFDYQAYYNFLYSILFKNGIKYAKFVVQLMYVPEKLSEIIMSLMERFKKKFNILINEYYKNNSFNYGYQAFYYFILNTSVSWIFKASWASNYGKLHIIEKDYRESMFDLLKNFMN